MSPSKRASTARAYLALGSNLGDREAHLRSAISELRARAGAEVLAVSSLYATEAVGIEDAPEFLNAALGVATPLAPEALLEVCLEIEAHQGRKRAEAQVKGRWASRTLDVDLLAYDDLERATPRLTLPHPRLTERPFVLVPLAEIAPGLRVRGAAVRDWAARAGTVGVRVSRPRDWWSPETGSSRRY